MKFTILAAFLAACTTAAPGPVVFRPEMHGSNVVPQAWTDRVTESAKRWDDGLAPRCGHGMVTVSVDGSLTARLVPTAIFTELGADEFSGGPGTIGNTFVGEGFGISGELSSLSNPTWALESTQHEIGHNLGLGHSTDRTSIMWPEDLGRDMKPNADDINAVADLLGCGAAPSIQTNSKPGSIETN